MKQRIAFDHRQSAHCESGVTANLLRHYGIQCSEAMAFGIGEGLFFAYLPFLRVNHLPLTTFRGPVGSIFGKVTTRLGVKVQRRRFHSETAAMEALDEGLARGLPIGCQTGAFWLPYFPPAFRFHFNMHNLVVIGREDDDYLISDPVFEEVVRCHRDDLQRARFAKGALAPRGAMYWLESAPSHPDLAAAARHGLRATCRTMLSTPLPLVGVRGIRFLAGRLQRWPQRLGRESALLHLGQLIRMQEEIGTGGGGFRFMFAAFLQEAAQLLQLPELATLSEGMTRVGDIWRDFAVCGARMCKGRERDDDSFDRLAATLRRCADEEQAVYRQLLEVVR